MDTRFWGPSGWRLLHMTAFQAPTLPTSSLSIFLTHLPYVLPCKYCRASLTDYYGADPIPKESTDMAEWMYRIHNRVNGKLREQKLLETPDPKWIEIRERYETWSKAPCSTRRMVGWDFLFSIAYTTPGQGTKSTPMPNAPPAPPTAALRNRWNLLSAKERFPYLERWWESLETVLPFPEWRDAWKAAIAEHGSAPVRKGRKSMTAWLYKVEKTVCSHLREIQPHDTYNGLCSELSTFSSGCGKSKRSKTCRATKRHARLTLKKRRRHQYRATGGYL
jgi:hypothetical protein